MSSSFVTTGRTPPRLQSSFRGVIGAFLALGCGTSRIEAVVSEDVTAQAGAPAMAPDDAGCHEPAAGAFIFRAEAGCLSRGEETTVFGTPALRVEVSADCTSPAARWQLIPAVAGTFNVRNAETKLLLDVRAGSDLPGTPLLLYDANMLDNQRFWLRPRAADAHELAARHAPSLCAEARVTDVEMWPCEPTASEQGFVLVRSECQ